MNSVVPLATRMHGLKANRVIESVRSNSKFFLESGYSEKELSKLYKAVQPQRFLIAQENTVVVAAYMQEDNCESTGKAQA